MRIQSTNQSILAVRYRRSSRIRGTVSRYFMYVRSSNAARVRINRDKAANPARGQLNRENKCFSVPVLLLFLTFSVCIGCQPEKKHSVLYKSVAPVAQLVIL